MLSADNIKFFLGNRVTILLERAVDLVYCTFSLNLHICHILVILVSRVGLWF